MVDPVTTTTPTTPSLESIGTGSVSAAATPEAGIISRKMQDRTPGGISGVKAWVILYLRCTRPILPDRQAGYLPKSTSGPAITGEDYKIEAHRISAGLPGGGLVRDGRPLYPDEPLAPRIRQHIAPRTGYLP